MSSALRCRRGRAQAAPPMPWRARWRAPATALARRGRRPGAPARRGLGAAHRHRAGPAALDDPLRAAGLGQDDAGADRGRGGPRRAGGAQRRRGRARRRCARCSSAPSTAGSWPSRRSSSSTRSTASTRPSRTRCCRRSRRASSPSSAPRRRTPTSRSTPRCSRAARSTSCARCSASDIEVVLRRAVETLERRGRRRRDRLPGRARRRRRPHGARRVRPRGPHPRPGDARGRRGRAAAPRADLRQDRRPPLRHDLGLDQGHARLGPRRQPLLPRGHARGRRGPALHRAADGHPRLRGHRQRRPARARGRGRRGPGDRARRPARGPVRARPGGDLPLARAEVRQREEGDRRRPRARARARRQAAAGLPAERRLQRGGPPGPRRRLRLPPRPPGPSLRPGAAPEGVAGERFYTPDDAEAALRERLEEIRRAREGGSLASPWRRPQPLPSWSPSARPPASDWARWRCRDRARSPPRWRWPRACSRCGRCCASAIARATWSARRRRSSTSSTS